MSEPMELRGVDLVVIPAYQPSALLLDLVKDVTAAGYGAVVVDDGSTMDRQWIFAQLEALPAVVVLHHPQNRGKGAALKTAFQTVWTWNDPTAYLVTMDADGQHLPQDAERVLQEARTHPGALVLGTRTFGRGVPLRSRVGNALTRVAFHLLSRTKVADTQTGLRAFGFSQLTYLLETEGSGYDYEMNVLLHCKRHGIPLVEVPIQTVYLDEHNSASHFHSLRDSWKVLKMLLKFASVSLISFALDYGLFLLLSTATQQFAYGLLCSNVAARLGSGFFNYQINRTLVFHSQENQRKTLVEYLLLATGILLANNGILSLFAYGLSLPLWLAKLLTEGSLFLVSLTVQTKVIFRGGGGLPPKKGEVKSHASDPPTKTA